LARVRARMDVTWEPLRAAGCLAAALLAGALLLGGPRARASAPRTHPSISREVTYLVDAQDPNGGFGAARGQSSSELYSAWAALGLAAAGRDPLSVRRGGHSVLDALRAEAASLQGAGD